MSVFGDTKARMWWTSDKNAVGLDVTKTAEAISQQSRAAREDTRFYLDLYSNNNTAGNDLGFGPSPVSMFGKAFSKMRYNLVNTGVDTAASLIAQNRTAPIYTTSLGDFALSRKAENRSRVLQGQFYDLGVYPLAADCFFDGSICGLGALYGYVENGQPCLERVLPNELLVDDSDGRYRSPRSIYRIRFVAKEVLKGLHPKFASEIERATGPSDRDYAEMYIRKDPEVERVRVVEAWHLPSGEGAKDGRHVLAISCATLVDERWTLKRFPFAFYRYANRRIGFFGQGLAERLSAAQIRMNEVNSAIKSCQDLCSNAWVLYEENSNVEWEDLTNMPGQAIRYRGTAPTIVTYSGTPPDLLAEREAIKKEAFDAEGLSEVTASGEREKGLSSGRAQRAVDSLKARRLVQSTRQFEQFFLDITILISDLNDMCTELDPAYMTRSRRRNGRQTFVQRMAWKELQFDDESNTAVTLFPMSAQPTEPAAKIQQLEEMIQGGFVSKPMALELMQMPDLDAYLSMETADVDLVQWQLEEILDGRQELPIPNQDLTLAAIIMNKAYMVAYRMKAPDDILLMIDNYIAYAKELGAAPLPPPVDPTAAASMDQGAAAAANVALAQSAGTEPMAGQPPMMMG